METSSDESYHPEGSPSLSEGSVSESNLQNQSSDSPEQDSDVSLDLNQIPDTPKKRGRPRTCAIPDRSVRQKPENKHRIKPRVNPKIVLDLKRAMTQAGASSNEVLFEGPDADEFKHARDYFNKVQREALEGLISKYSNMPAGDEIDLRTGAIIDDNGHLEGLGVQPSSIWDEGASDSEMESEGETNNLSQFQALSLVIDVTDPCVLVCERENKLLDSIVLELMS